jgi:phytoene synthase
MSDNQPYITEFLKTNDRDRYLASLIVPEDKRADIQSLYAFNADIAAIPTRVSEPAPGEIRLQWWHDTLSGTQHGEVTQNPLAAELLDMLKRYSLPTGPLLRLIAARRFDLYQDPMPDMQTFEGYAGETAAALYQYAAMILANGEEPPSGDASGHLGVAHALIGHMRAFGYNASRGRIFLPLAIFAANGVTDQQMLAGENSAAIATATRQLREIARNHLSKAEEAIAQLPKTMRPAYAQWGVLNAELKQLEKAQDPLAPPRQIPDWRKIATLVVWMLRKA